MKPTNKQLVEWFEHLYKSGAIYLWGANSETITKNLTDRLFAWFGSKTFNKDYYETKLKDGEGKLGADCSGSFKPISGIDLTAQGYYERCKENGSIAKIPRNKVCQVFKRSLTGKITHVGLYCGNGYTIEMKSSKANCVKEKLNIRRWSYYGIPDWIDYVKENPYPVPSRAIEFGCEGEDVKWVQQELLDHGIKFVVVGVSKRELTIDGDCGKITQAAIKAYQKLKHLKPDGVCGPITRASLEK